MATDFEVQGLDDLYRQLQELPGKIEGNIMRGALRAGMREMQEAARANVPVHDGDLRKSIRISFRGKSQKYGWVRMHLVAGDKKAYYAHMVEYGTAQHIISAKTRDGGRVRMGKKLNKLLKSGSLVIGGNYVGSAVLHPGAKPHPFMRPAFDASSERALTTVKDYIAKRLPRELKKAGQ